MKKRVNELSDDGEMFGEFSNYWAILADKGYHGLQDQMKIVILKKKSMNGLLTVADRNQNKAISYDRIIVENYLVVCAGLV